MLTVASLFSGIGGMDCGFKAHGWRIGWQTEKDAYRRSVLIQRFGCAIAHETEAVPLISENHSFWPRPDVLYAEAPDSDVARWWGPTLAALRHVQPVTWFVYEFSPTVRCEQVLRDLALDSWAFRLLHVSTVIPMSWLARAEWHSRTRAFILASRQAQRVDALPVCPAVEVVIEGLTAHWPRGSTPWQEERRGLPASWSCACGQPSCACDAQARRRAVDEAGSPFTGQWLAETIDGVR